MFKQSSSTVIAKVQPSITDSTVVISAGSYVFDNNWIDFSGTVFNVTDYINSKIGPNRKGFFNGRGDALCIIVGLNSNGELEVEEGTQVVFTTAASVPIPSTFTFIPLVGIILIQDGTADMIGGLKPLKDNNVIFYSGTGNVIDKNLKGIVGVDSNIQGFTGLQGETGLIGIDGLQGPTGYFGITGRTGYGITGLQGLQGMTGINWDIQILFDHLV
jgi:hypothetical protein